MKLLPSWPEFALPKVRSAAGLVEVLVERGYPAPRFRDVGEIDGMVYTVQEYVEGEESAALVQTNAGELLRIWRRHEDVLPPGAGGAWGADLIRGIARGEELRTRTSDPRVLGILDRLQSIADAAEPAVFRTSDVVHGDFHPGNVLFRNGAVAAVIDWESALAGDSRADLLRFYAAVAFWAEPDSTARRLLRDELEATTPREVWLPMAAALVAYLLRYGVLAKPAELEWVLGQAEILLPKQWTL